MTASTAPGGLTDLRLLEHFVRVAQTGSFSRAATALGITQSALSRQVRALEVELACTLLRRTGRGVQLTDAGRCLLEHAQTIRRQLDTARQEVRFARGAFAGRVAVGLPPSLGRALAVPLVSRCSEAFPQASIAITEGLSSHLVEWIKTGTLDIAVVHNPEPSPLLEVQPLLEERLHLMSAPGGDTDGCNEVDFAELVRYPLILPDRTTAIRRLIETRAAHAGLHLSIAYEVSSIGAILELVARGLGQSVLPPSATYAQEPPARLTARPVVKPRLQCVVALASSAQRPATPLLLQVSQTLGELVRRLLDRSA